MIDNARAGALDSGANHRVIILMYRDSCAQICWRVPGLRIMVSAEFAPNVPIDQMVSWGLLIETLAGLSREPASR